MECRRKPARCRHGGTCLPHQGPLRGLASLGLRSVCAHAPILPYYMC